MPTGIVSWPTRTAYMIGTWPSLVRRLTGGQEIGGSNPLVPTRYNGIARNRSPVFFLYSRLFITLVFLPLTIATAQCQAAILTPVQTPFSSPLTVQGYRYYMGIGVPKNYGKALRFYLRAAEQGDPQAQFIVGGMLYRGQGTDPNQKEAVKWLLRAADKGVWSPESLRILGTMYLQGTGVPQNFQEAEHYLERATELGDLIARKNLAYMFFNGLTGRRDYKRALELYRKAALAGDPSSQYNMGIMYAQGLGTAMDRAKAYAWFSLAASQGNGAARMASNDLMTRMSWQELTSAQALSVQLFKEVEQHQNTAR